MKKSLKILLTVCCVVVFLALSFFVYMFQAINNAKIFGSSLAINKEQYKLEKTTDDTVKILQLTDLQFASYFEAGLSLGIAKGAITKTKPDLIVLTGDNITNNSERRHAELLVRFFDSFHI